jgi:MFS family permease
MAAPLPRTVKSLGLVSLLTDASSEMIYPLLPSFVTTTLKGGAAFLGVIEGAAEAVASLSKIVSGAWSDRAGRRKPLVVGGYALSSLARPLIALATAPWHVLLVRVSDRVGKGVRGAPRDALIASVTDAADRGRAYGFHRAMDHAGAVVGPLIASALLAAGVPLRTVFALAVIPGVLSILALVLGVKEDAVAAPVVAAAPVAGDDASWHAALRGGLGRYLAVLALFTLGNSSDAFLLLRARDAGVGLALVPLLWSFHHVVKSGLGTAGGGLSDRLGRRRVIALGYAVYALSYAGFAAASRPLHVWALFAVYGVFFALTEGAERALVAELAGPAARGRAFGLYYAITGAALLPASVLTGALWQRFSPAAALFTGAALAGAAALGLLLAVPERARA